ncbi:hypothetical protein F5Y17DRAFT_70406 [Xylariaceae sp. FL0594]|nr:hypothetical protein F5Y17DRAFT_70406 [Xylariaceae sp. FL0594]
MQPLSTRFTPSPWCSNRYAVFIDKNTHHSSTIPPSSGWFDPSFTRCIPSQYTTAYPTFSPGVCPHQMEIVRSRSRVHHGKTTWIAACCQRCAENAMTLGRTNWLQGETNVITMDNSGFAPLSIDPEYMCTSNITSPMTFLLDPNISTTDIYTTLTPPAAPTSEPLWIVHDQITVQWQKSDLKLFPEEVASQYARIMGFAGATTTSTGEDISKDTRTIPQVSSTSASNTEPSKSVTVTALITEMSSFQHDSSPTSIGSPSISESQLITTTITAASGAPVKNLKTLIFVLQGIFLVVALLITWCF